VLQTDLGSLCDYLSIHQNDADILSLEAWQKQIFSCLAQLPQLTDQLINESIYQQENLLAPLKKMFTETLQQIGAY